MIALQYMIDQYGTLKILADISETSPHPTQYQCIPRELILRSSQGWEKITTDLKQLESESLVEISSGATPLFNITEKGLRKIRVLEGRP